MYQASASFQQTCLQQMQTLNATVGEACHEVVGQALEKPRTWGEYFEKGAKRDLESFEELLSTRGWPQSVSNGANLMYDEIADTVEEEPESTKAERVEPGPVRPRIGRFWRCTQESSYSGRPKPPVDYVCWAALDVVDWLDVEVDHECIRMQDDASVMYGGMPSYELLGSIVYEDVSTLKCEQYGSYVDEPHGSLYGWNGSSGSNTLALRRAEMTRVLFHIVHDPRQWEYLSWPRLVWNTTGWDVEDMRVVEGLAVTLIVTMVGYMMMRKKRAC